MDSTKRGDYYHGLYLGVLRGAGPSPRVIVKFHFEEKHKFTYDEWWFDTSIKENCGFFRGHFDTKLNDKEFSTTLGALNELRDNICSSEV